MYTNDSVHRVWFPTVTPTCNQNATILMFLIGAKNKNGPGISITYVATTLSFRNHSGRWCQYQASGVGIHWKQINKADTLVTVLHADDRRTWSQNATTLIDLTGEKKRNGVGICMRYVETTLNFRNQVGKWCQYQANGVGIHCEENSANNVRQFIRMSDDDWRILILLMNTFGANFIGKSVLCSCSQYSLIAFYFKTRKSALRGTYTPGW